MEDIFHGRFCFKMISSRFHEHGVHAEAQECRDRGLGLSLAPLLTDPCSSFVDDDSAVTLRQ